MWEIIARNKRNSYILIGAMLCLMLAIGYSLGLVLSAEGGAEAGMVMAFGIWMFLAGTSYLWGDSILLSSSRAKEVTPEVHPMLFNVVEEMKIAANLPAIPKVYIMDETAPNAFATGIKPGKCAVAVTVGLLTRLNRDELQGVIGHEISHVANRDILYMTLAGTMLGSIQLLTRGIFRGSFRNGGSSKRFRSGGSSSGGGAVILVLLLVTVIGALLARLFYFALSRKREYLADACSARYTRYPEGLASALEKIDKAGMPLPASNEITAPMYIAEPLKSESAFSFFESTHPPIEERVRILRGMMQGASFMDYEKSFRRVKGEEESLLPPSALEDQKAVPVRRPSQSLQTQSAGEKESLRGAGDLMRAVNNFAFLICDCGLKIKVPPDFKEPKIPCPRCGIIHPSPFFGPIGRAEEGFYTRKSDGWESLACACGKLLQISPSFAAPAVVCSSCGRRTQILATSLTG